MSYSIGTIEDLASIEMGQSPKGDTVRRSPTGLPLLNGPTEFGQQHPVPAQWTDSGVRFARAGDVLFCVRGSTTGRMNRADQDYAIGRGIAALRARDGVDSRIVKYALDASLSDLLAGVSGSVFPNLSRDQILRHRVPVPPRAEQQAIVEVLGALDDKIAANNALAATAEQLLRTEMDAVWLRSHDRSSTLSDLVELNPKVAVPRTESAVYVDMKRLPESGWSVDGFDYCEPKGGARFRNGDTLLARITPCLENRKTGFVDQLPEGEIGVGSTEFIVLRARDGIAPPISFLLATATRFRDHAIQHMIGTSGRQRVAASDLASFELPTPDPDWLTDFGSRAVAVFDLVASQNAENRTLAATRDALLPQLMSGKLRVRDAENAVSEAGHAAHVVGGDR